MERPLNALITLKASKMLKKDLEYRACRMYFTPVPKFFQASSRLKEFVCNFQADAFHGDAIKKVNSEPFSEILRSSLRVQRFQAFMIEGVRSVRECNLILAPSENQAGN